jgi:hypothetical protein
MVSELLIISRNTATLLFGSSFATYLIGAEELNWKRREYENKDIGIFSSATNGGVDDSRGRILSVSGN